MVKHVATHTQPYPPSGGGRATATASSAMSASSEGVGGEAQRCINKIAVSIDYRIGCDLSHVSFMAAAPTFIPVNGMSLVRLRGVITPRRSTTLVQACFGASLSYSALQPLSKSHLCFHISWRTRQTSELLQISIRRARAGRQRCMLGVWGRLVHFFCLLRPFLFSLAIPVAEKVKVRTHDDGVFDKLLHAINKTIPVTTRHEPASSVLLGELLVCHGYRTLVRDHKHTHPSTEYA